jgi:hypothetical protein
MAGKSGREQVSRGGLPQVEILFCSARDGGFAIRMQDGYFRTSGGIAG